jgi:Arc/MetJ-type ribon-helix-helix transcriptional regulator
MQKRARELVSEVWRVCLNRPRSRFASDNGPDLRGFGLLQYAESERTITRAAERTTPLRVSIMQIHLPEDLQRFVAEQVRTGRFPSEDQVVCEAVRQFMQAQQTSVAQAVPDSWIGSMREDADLLDAIVEEAMRIRETRPWRLPAGE